MSHANAPKRPKGRALTDFKNLTWAEKKLLICASRGVTCNLGLNVPAQPSRHNAIRPELIRFLALGGDENAPVHEKGIILEGAYIGAALGEGSSTLDCEGTRLTTSLWLWNCRFASELIFRDARAINLSLQGSVFPGFSAGRLKLAGDLVLRCTDAKGQVNLQGADIGGNLDCSGGVLTDYPLKKKDRVALCCDGAKIGGDIFLNFYSIQKPKETRCFSATGQVSLIGASIGGDLDCSGGYFQNKMGTALTLERASIGGSVFCNKGFHATGEVRLNAATIAVNLACEGGRFHNEGGRALTCDGAKIDGGVFFKIYDNPSQDQKLPFEAIGEVRLSRVDIGKDLDCSGGHFENKEEKNTKKALLCHGARISGNIFCSDEFRSIGELNFIGATIGGDLYFRRACLANRNGMALSCERTKIDGALLFRDVAVLRGFISFAHTTVGTLVDELFCWPDQSLNLEGFRYERIDSSSSLDAHSRITWLNKQVSLRLAGENFSIQPWIHLAKVLREQGHFREAAEVDIAREERLRAAGKVGNPKWGQIDDLGRYVTFVSSLDDYFAFGSHWLYGKFSGYGYRPMRIVYTAMVLWLCGAILFSMAADNSIFSPTNAATAKALGKDCEKQFAPEKIVWTRCDALLKTYPRFSPWAYSLDLILPVARLGQSASWTPVSDGGWLSLSGWTQRLVWFEEIFGWVAALTLAAIAAGLVKRKDG